MKSEHGQEAIVTYYEVDLRVDLNTEDDTGLPWAPISDARDPSLVKEGA